MIPHFIIKLPILKFPPTPQYNQLFSPHPTSLTQSIPPLPIHPPPILTKNSFPFLHSLHYLAPTKQTNLTILSSTPLPQNFKI
ncbi:pyruvate formate lyase family protein, partial [Staphylococcus epidermidis]|uniref:pyruvate formate lyase family protein n=1 Tax=Staphylococcus epidermidis TaxID=1282 RepID=UPI0037DA204D